MFLIKKGDIISVTGAGGKTSLIYFLSKELSKKGSVLITTTTKMYKPEKERYAHLIVNESKIKGNNINIDILGEKIENDKLFSPKYDKIMVYSKGYDYTLIEADGAKELMMKEWNNTEPCIPNFVNKNIGIINMELLGKEVSNKNIHRFEIFQKKYNIKEKSKVDIELLREYMNRGEFHRGCIGERLFFLNGIESIEAYESAIRLSRGRIDTYLGSIHDKWIEKRKTIDAIVMASGFSRRFGSNKLLAEYNGTPIIEHLLVKLKNIPFNKVVVIGNNIEIERLAKEYGYEYIENTGAHLGQSESVKLGANLSKANGMMFFTGDQPLLTRESILRIMLEYQKNNKITRPMIDEKPSTPTIFPSRFKDELSKVTGDSGGREVIKSHIDELHLVEFKDKREFKDIDTIEDLEGLI